MKSINRYITVSILLLLLGSMLAWNASETVMPTDVMTQTIPDPDKTTVTVLVKSAFSIHEFEKAAEEKFPELDLIQVGNYTSDMGIAEYEARLKHDDITDVVVTWPLEVGEEYWSERLLDLSAQPFTNRYNGARLDRIARDGKLYYLPGPSQVRAIVYNKTLFREQGWSVPTDFEGFLSLCKQIEATGIRALQLGLENEEVLDTAFVGYNLANCYSTPADVQWIADYNNGIGKFADHFMPALHTFQQLIDGGVLQPVDLERTYADREKMLFNRQCAMVEDSVLVARMGSSYNGCTDEFGLMPFFNQSEQSDWVRLYPVCYIGLNKHLAEPQYKEKYELVLRLMDYISSEEGQLALMGDTGAMFSSLNGMSPPDNIPEITDILQALKHARYAVFPVLSNAQGALRQGLAGMVEGSMTEEEVARMVDAQNAAPPIPAAIVSIGKATKDFTMIETGNFVTDAMREKSNCDIALFLDNGKDGKFNGKGIGARLYQGELTSLDINRILPDLRQGERGTMWKITMTGEDLLHTLEYTIPVDNNHIGWFYYFSGLRMEYAPAAEPGTRIHKITDTKGQAIDLKKIYSVAVMDHTVLEDAMVTCEDTGITIRSILEEALAEAPITPSEDGRFVIPDAKSVAE